MHATTCSYDGSHLEPIRWRPMRFPSSLFAAFFAAAGAFNSPSTDAAQIEFAKFPQPFVIEDFDSLGAGSSTIEAPWNFGSYEFDSSEAQLTVSSKLGPLIGRSGRALRAGDGSGSPGAFLEINLDEPASAMGVWVGGEFAWDLSVTFLNSDRMSLGMINLSGSPQTSLFAGWQSDAADIAFLRISNSLASAPIIVDDLVRQVPEASSIVLLLCGSLLVVSKSLLAMVFAFEANQRGG